MARQTWHCPRCRALLAHVDGMILRIDAPRFQVSHQYKSYLVGCACRYVMTLYPTNGVIMIEHHLPDAKLSATEEHEDATH